MPATFFATNCHIHVVMVVLALVPIALLHYPVKWLERLVSKISWLRKICPTASIAILLDIFQGWFRDNRRYFAGLYLALRLLFFAAYILPFFQQFLIQQILYVVYILLLVVLKPYKEKYLNYLDISMLTNLALINIFTWYTTNVVQTEEVVNIQICIAIESVLVFLPLAYFTAYLIWVSTRRYHTSARTALTDWYHAVQERFKRRANPQLTSISLWYTTPFATADDVIVAKWCKTTLSIQVQLSVLQVYTGSYL